MIDATDKEKDEYHRLNSAAGDARSEYRGALRDLEDAQEDLELREHFMVETQTELDEFVAQYWAPRKDPSNPDKPWVANAVSP